MLSVRTTIGGTVFRSTSKDKSVAIIGAGAAGLITLYHLRKRNIDATIYEAKDHVGGIWKIDDTSPLYDGLVTNLPKQVMAFNPDFPFDARLPSFVTHHDMYNYLHDFSVSNGLTQHICFNTEIVNVEKGVSSVSDPGGVWKVRCQERSASSLQSDGGGREWESEHSAVVVCNGHFNLPVSAALPGAEHFAGLLMHSADYRHPEEQLGSEMDTTSAVRRAGPFKYRGRRVLVVGAKSSATDITKELAAVARSIHVSDRNCAASFSYDARSGGVLPPTASADGSECEGVIHVHPGIARVASSGVLVMADDSELLVDVVIMCTGYEYDFPFLPGSSSDSSGPPVTVTVNNRSVRQLYQHMYWLQDPTLAFVGLNHTIVPFPVFNYQAMHLAAALASWRGEEGSADPSSGGGGGSPILPPLAERVAALEREEQALVPGGWHAPDAGGAGGTPAACREREKLLRNYHHMGERQWGYLRGLVEQAEGSCEPATDRHLRMMAALYAAVSGSRPPRVGLPDEYRASEYVVDP